MWQQILVYIVLAVEVPVELLFSKLFNKDLIILKILYKHNTNYNYRISLNN